MVARLLRLRPHVLPRFLHTLSVNTLCEKSINCVREKRCPQSGFQFAAGALIRGTTGQRNVWSAKPVRVMMILKHLDKLPLEA